MITKISKNVTIPYQQDQTIIPRRVRGKADLSEMLENQDLENFLRMGSNTHSIPLQPHRIFHKSFQPGDSKLGKPDDVVPWSSTATGECKGQWGKHSNYHNGEYKGTKVAMRENISEGLIVWKYVVCKCRRSL